MPLVKKDGLPEKAREIMNDLKFPFHCQYDEKDSIGKRYRRQEAIHELSTDLEYRQQIRLLGLLYKGKPANTTEIKEWANSPSYYRKRTLLRILPTAVTIINFLLCLIFCFCFLDYEPLRFLV